MKSRRRLSARAGVASLLALITVAALGMAAVSAAQGETTRVSLDSAGDEANGHSLTGSVSADGRHVAFLSDASDLVPGDTNGVRDVFVRDRETGQTIRVSVHSDGTQSTVASDPPALSADGGTVAFSSAAPELVDGDTNSASDVFVHDIDSGGTTRVSVHSNGTQATGRSVLPRLSADGGSVAFASAAPDLVAGDTNGAYDVFVHDVDSGETTRVSIHSNGTQADNHTSDPGISADGRYVVFNSEASNLVAGDTNGVLDVFLRDRDLGLTTRVSVRSDGSQVTNGWSAARGISASGGEILMAAQASDLVDGDTNGAVDLFVHDVDTAATTRVSVAGDGSQSIGQNWEGAISGDGRYVAFSSQASNLVDGDTNGSWDVFVHERLSGSTARVSIHTNGTQGSTNSDNPSISGDGRYVTFTGWSAGLVDDDTNGVADVLIHQYLPDPPPTTTTIPTTTTSPPTTSTTTPPPTTTVPPDGARFVDDDGSVFEEDIEAIAAAGITKGCNPPANDRFCPDDDVTRGEMAAFVNRAADLAASDVDAFVDDDGSVFEADIDAVSAAGITKGCNPPANDRFCPERSLTRGEMAALLRRALRLPASDVDAFVDDDDSIFEADLDAIAAGGIARGCNPPASDRVCPDDNLTRGQMAAFLNRAFLR